VTGAPNGSLKGKTVLIIGHGSGLARAVAVAALDAGAYVEDIAQGVMFALTNTFLTGQTLHIDGGEPLT
jgi:hypothetical protein